MSRVALGGGLESLGALREALRVAAVSAWRAQGRVVLRAHAAQSRTQRGSSCWHRHRLQPSYPTPAKDPALNKALPAAQPKY